MTRLAFTSWRPGMRCAGGRLRVDAVSKDGRPYRIEENRGFGDGLVDSPHVEVYPHRGALPDLGDMPTVGALLEVARERCQELVGAGRSGAAETWRDELVAAMNRWIHGGSTEDLGAEVMQLIGPAGVGPEGT